MTTLSTPAPATSRPRPRLLADIALLVTCIAVAGAIALLRRQDVNWDLLNYHFYNPWAWWNGRIFTRDIAAAQLQTYHNVVFDLPFYGMVAANWAPRVITLVLAIPAGIAAFFLAKLLPLLFADLPRTEHRVAVVASFAIGVTSAMGIATLGTTMNEWPLVALIMPALWLVVRALVRGALSRRVLAVAGVLVGLAAGGKLTAATFAVGLCAALLIRGPYDARSLRRASAEAFVFGLGVLAGLAVTFGPWGYALWTHFESPIFPYANEWIKSPWLEARSVSPRSYGPHDFGEWLLFPFRLLAPVQYFVSEVPYRDPRFPLTWALAIIAGAAWLSHRLSGKPMPDVDAGVSAAWRFVSAFVVVSFLVWTAQHSIYRYLVTLDMLTGALIVTLLQRLLRPSYFAGVAILSAIAIVAMTRFGDWWHIDFGPRWFDVSVPKIEDHALVLLTSDEPMSYVLPFFPADARHLGIHNNISSPEQRSLMQAAIARAIRDHAGPIYSLTFPAGSGAESLEPYGLSTVPDSCRNVISNMPISPIALCRLARDDHG